MADTAGGNMPATKTKRQTASKDPFAQFRGGVDGLAQQLRNRRAQGWESQTFEQIAHEIERLQGLASQLDQRWASLLAQLHGPMSAARVAQRMPDAGATAQLISTAEHLLLQLPSAGKPGDDTPQRAESPPQNYWRRWSEDAPPADAQDASMGIPPAPTPPDVVPLPPLGGEEPPFRVLIVEDDRAQALFAEGVLNGAGIEALVASDPKDVIDTMVRTTPDLVLMDLHMPGLSGTELTQMIRRHEAFLHMPIVFLTGDTDPEKQFEVLEIGADDFLQKPIRPRHLIAAIESRVKRARALGKQRMTEASRHPATGLMARPHLLQQLNAALPAENGGAFFLEIEGTPTLRERYGYAALERLMTEAGRRLGELAGTHPATRLNDHSFLVYTPGLDDNGLERQSRVWRDGISQHHFEVDGHSIRLRLTVGYAALRHGFTDAGSVLEAAELASRQARSQATSIASYEPPDRGMTSDLSGYLRDALADDRFELIYQPIVAVAGGDEAQYQTLLRMHGADGTLHNAAEIVPAAETSGIIHDIDRWVLERGLDVLQQRRAQGRPVRLFVPQSPRTLARDAYAEWLASAISVRGLEGPSLVIDVRLADALIHGVTLRQFCDQLVPVGVQFCLSQYEHSPDADSLLSQLPLGYIRLSARYAHAEAGALRDAMRTSIDRAHRQGLQVIGHSVEDPQAAATLWMSGIDFIQGNLVQHAASELDFDFKNAVL
jgi:EAL domain-containing protein (putative c-di-GMP-specific phosphodiesterase class I)/DNA-binding response OmpR family regulator